MSTGVVSILLHQLPYNGHWLQVISVIFFVLNLALFLLFTAVSCLRYILYPQLFPAVLRHPHQSLFLATFPVGLATLINMTVLVCVPMWGNGIVTFAWVLWWIVSVMALVTCFHLTFVMWVMPLVQFTFLYELFLYLVIIMLSLLKQHTECQIVEANWKRWQHSTSSRLFPSWSLRHREAWLQEWFPTRITNCGRLLSATFYGVLDRLCLGSYWLSTFFAWLYTSHSSGKSSCHFCFQLGLSVCQDSRKLSS